MLLLDILIINNRPEVRLLKPRKAAVFVENFFRGVGVENKGDL
jgi:hypothetical protein